MDDALIKSALTTAIAAEIIEKLPPEQKHALLIEALTESLKDWKVQSQINDAVLVVVNREIRELLSTDDAQQRIHDRVQRGFDEVLEAIVPAVESGVKEFLFGVESTNSYSREPGKIVKHLRSGANA